MPPLLIDPHTDDTAAPSPAPAPTPAPGFAPSNVPASTWVESPSLIESHPEEPLPVGPIMLSPPAPPNPQPTPPEAAPTPSPEHAPEPAPAPTPTPLLIPPTIEGEPPPPAPFANEAAVDAVRQKEAQLVKDLFNNLDDLGGHLNTHGQNFADEQKAQLAVVRFLAFEKKTRPENLADTFPADLANLGQSLGIPEPTSLKVYGALQAKKKQDDARQAAYQNAKEHTWSRTVEENTGAPINFSPDHFNQWTVAHPEAFKGRDSYETFHDYVNIVSGASDEAAPMARKVRQVADLIKSSTTGIAAITPGSVDQAVDIFAGMPAASRPLAFGMLRAYTREHGIDPKNFLTMLAEVPARVATDAYSGLTLVPYEARLNRTIFELQHGVARLLKNGQVDLAMVRLTDDDELPPGETSDLGVTRMMGQWHTRPVTDAERDVLIAQARQELERIRVVYQLRGFLAHEYDPVKTTMGGVGGFFQNVAYFGATAGSYVAVGAIPEAGPVAAGMAFVGTSINDLRTQYPDLKPEDAIALGTSIAVAQMLILGGMGRVVAGDARGATLWLRGLDASKPVLTQTALRLAAESATKGVKLTGLMAASTAVPLAVKLLGEEAGMKIPGFDALEEWRTLAHPQPETLGILAILWLTGAGVSATRYAQVAKLAKDYGFATEDANRFAAAGNLSERLDAFEQGMANMTPEARLALAQAVDNGIFRMKQAKEAYLFGRSGRVILINESIETSIGKKLSDLEVTTLVGAPGHAELYVDGSGFPPRLDISIRCEEVQIQERRISRTADGRLILDNILFVKSKKTPPGYGGWSLTTQIKAARKLGISEIHTLADGHYGDELFIGYYVWPRYGFDAELSESTRKILPPDLKNSKTVLDIMETPAGRVWWRVNGHPMEMQFDLKDGSRSIKVLKSYMSEKGFTDIGL